MGDERPDENERREKAEDGKESIRELSWFSMFEMRRPESAGWQVGEMGLHGARQYSCAISHGLVSFTSWLVAVVWVISDILRTS